MSMALIFFASESFFIKNEYLNSSGSSLLIFLLVGEISLILPMSFSEKFLTNFVEIKNQHFYQTLLGLKISPLRYVLAKTLSDSLFSLVRVLLIVSISSVIFKLNLSLTTLLFFSLVQLLGVFLFLLLAIVTSLIYLKFNKGVGLFNSLGSVAAVLGGAYFPTSALPMFLRNISSALPQTQIIYSSRQIFSGQTVPIVNLMIIASWILGLAFFTKLFDTYIKYNLKKHNAFL
jgi:ABC-type multidrug transport system permease subunit